MICLVLYINYCLSPGVHPAVNDGVIHRVAHGQPIDDEEHLLNIPVVANAVINGYDNEVHIIG